jgi:hypothetical protein
MEAWNAASSRHCLASRVYFSWLLTLLYVLETALRNWMRRLFCYIRGNILLRLRPALIQVQFGNSVESWLNPLSRIMCEMTVGTLRGEHRLSRRPPCSMHGEGWKDVGWTSPFLRWLPCEKSLGRFWLVVQSSSEYFRVIQSKLKIARPFLLRSSEFFRVFQSNLE